MPPSPSGSSGCATPTIRDDHEVPQAGSRPSARTIAFGGAKDPRAIRRSYRIGACSRFDWWMFQSQALVASGPRRASTGSSPRRNASM